MAGDAAAVVTGEDRRSKHKHWQPIKDGVECSHWRCSDTPTRSTWNKNQRHHRPTCQSLNGRHSS